MSIAGAGRKVPSLALLASPATDRACAAVMARRLGIQLLGVNTLEAVEGEQGTLVMMDGEHLSLQQLGRGAPGPISVDFGAAAMRHRRKGGHNELLGKAVGLRRKPALQVLDATAGLGRDSFVLADLACQVTLCEREPLIAALLESGLTAAAQGDDWLREVVARMSLHPGDARDLPAALLRHCEVIYLDPMFPQRAKSAAVKKEMAVFQRLLDRGEHQGDSEQLLHWALGQDVARVVVKRPLKATYLATLRPSHSISGKAVRFDVHVLKAFS